MLAWNQFNHDWDWGGAEASVRRALELAPGNVYALRAAGMVARARGRTSEALDFYHRALEQDPLSVGSYSGYAGVLFDAGRLDEAEAVYRKGLELAPQRALAHSKLATLLSMRGRNEEALAEAKQEPDEMFRNWALAIVYHALGRRAESDAALRELIEKNAHDSAAQIAEVYAMRGEADAAFEWLERAYEQRDSGLVHAQSNRHLASLHGDPRWRAFMRKMGFED